MTYDQMMLLLWELSQKMLLKTQHLVLPLTNNRQMLANFLSFVHAPEMNS